MVTAYPDWASLPTEMVAMVIASLEIPADLFRAGCVCSSWYAAYSAVRRVRIPITDKSPCLLYSARDDNDAGAATLYSATFKIRLPDQPLRSRALVGSAHGWLATADEASNLHLVNPLSGVQVALPPVTTLHHVESFVDGGGNLMYSLMEYGEEDDDEALPLPLQYPAQKLRLFLYHKVVMFCSPSKRRDCIVLLIHRQDGELSFAHIGDDRWTHITCQTLTWISGYRDAIYNKNNGLFYVLNFDGSMNTLDLSNPSSPVAKDIMPRAVRWNEPIKDLLVTPSGDVLQVLRLKEIQQLDTPIELPAGVAPHEIDDPYLVSRIVETFIHKVDIDKQDRVLLKSIGDNMLFLGCNSAVCLSTKDFSELSPDSAYVTDGFDEQMCGNTYNLREIGIWDFKTGTLRGLVEVQTRNPWLNWPAPIWISPSLH